MGVKFWDPAVVIDSEDPSLFRFNVRAYNPN